MRILLVQFADIGDLILTTPAISALREARPDVYLALLTSAHAAPVIEGSGLVDEIITFDKSAFNGTKAFFQPSNLRRIFQIGHFDTVVYFHHFTLKAGTLKFALIALAARAKHRIGLQNGNGWFLTQAIRDEGYGALHQAQYWLNLVALLGANPAPRPTRVYIEPADTTQNATDRKRVIIHAGSGGYSPARRWSPQQFAQVADRLHQELNAEIVLVGGKNDDAETVKTLMQSPAVDLTGKTTLPQLAGVIQRADLYIGADSGVMHLASATGTPIVAIFGPSNHLAWHPWTPEGRHIVVRSAPECSPCSYVGHSVGLREGSEARTCMKMVSTEMVVRAAKQLLEGSEPPIPLSPQPSILNPSSPIVRMLGFPVAAITYTEWLEMIGRWVREGQRPYHVCTINPEFMVAALHDFNFRIVLQRCDLCVPDGIGLLLAARMMGERLPERVTGSDGVPMIAERAAREGWRLFLLGAAPGIAEKAASVLSEKYPGLQIAGTYGGSPAPEEEDTIVQRINASRADILFVAYGAPKQDTWIARNLPRLQVKMAMGVGGAFDFIAGIVPRAPVWMRRTGLEWLYRLYLQPWRIRRQLRLPIFLLLVLIYGKRSP
jgi:N-acetylglucosaminyldiphosphoundecaprenol N-acetyl-beta-D-mannosaminyltransferase